jgi:hypothetical protein
MADFEDEFTESSAVILQSHTPDVGTQWDWNAFTGDSGFAVDATNDWLVASLNDVAETIGNGYGTINPSLGDADQQVWARSKSLSSDNRDAHMCVRLVDRANFIGWSNYGTGSLGNRLRKRVSGTLTDLVQSQGTDEYWYRVKAEGNTLSLWEASGSEPTDPTEDTNWTQVGTNQTVTDHNTETDCGVVNIGADSGASLTPWIDSFRANTVGAAGGLSIPVAMNSYRQRNQLSIG